MGHIVEQVEIHKANYSKPFYYTGIFSDLDKGWVEVRTIKGEFLKFRKEQVQSRREMPPLELEELKKKANI